MSDIITIAEAVADVLSVYNATVSFAPEFELEELQTMRCMVVPAAVKTVNNSRSCVQHTFRIEVGFMYRDKTLDMKSLLEEIRVKSLRFYRFSCGSASCFKVEINPLYDADSLRQRNQFTSVLVLHFKETENV